MIGLVSFIILGLLASVSEQTQSENAALQERPTASNQQINVGNFFRSRKARSVLETEITSFDSHRSKRSTSNVDVTGDSCHTLQTHDLPLARDSIRGAWNNSLEAVLSLSEAFEATKECATWNIFKAIPCGIKAVVQLVTSIFKYKPAILQLVKDSIQASANATTNFIECGKILLKHTSN